MKCTNAVVRVLNECKQILMDGNSDLRWNRAHLNAIRRGEVLEEDNLRNIVCALSDAQKKRLASA